MRIPRTIQTKFKCPCGCRYEFSVTTNLKTEPEQEAGSDDPYVLVAYYAKNQTLVVMIVARTEIWWQE